jgi:hypothetical protein
VSIVYTCPLLQCAAPDRAGLLDIHLARFHLSESGHSNLFVLPLLNYTHFLSKRRFDGDFTIFGSGESSSFEEFFWCLLMEAFGVEMVVRLKRCVLLLSETDEIGFAFWEWEAPGF